MSTHRRRFLRLCGVAGLGAVAGCSGGSDDDGTPADDASPEDSETATPTETTASTGSATKIVADDGDRRDEFGIAVALSNDGTTALIGADGSKAPSGEKPGSAYVFDNSGGSWTQQAKLTADDGDSGDGFGGSVALSSDGTTALVGARHDEGPNGANQSTNSGAGSAYAFDGSGGSWTQQAKLAADDRDSGNLFGRSVALSNNGRTALIGAAGEASVYVFDNSGGSWAQRTKVTADGAAQFGSAVSLSNDGTTALISERLDQDPNGYFAGSAYVFEDSGDSWTQQAKLAADDGDSRDLFGNVVALSTDGTTALIGARRDEDPNGEDGGSADEFENSDRSWSQQAKIAADDGASNDRFGSAVALSTDGTTALIGADGDEDPNGNDDSLGTGSVYVFDNSGGSWTQRAKLAADNGDKGDRFGNSVAMSSDGATALIGAYRDEDPNGERAGSAYTFDL